MDRYGRLKELTNGVSSVVMERRLEDFVIPFLTNLWLEEYRLHSSLDDVVETMAERGGTDINLVPQRGAINRGKFRKLEIEAVATPGAFYFSHWIYRSIAGQRPSHVEQGLLVPGAPLRISRFPN